MGEEQMGEGGVRVPAAAPGSLKVFKGGKMNRVRRWWRVWTHYLRYKLASPPLSFANYFITVKCNLKCIYCPVRTDTGSKIFDYCSSSRRELSTEEAKRAMEELGKLGTLWISFSGGEPLLRPDLEEIADKARREGMFTILDTNATLITKRRARTLSRVFDSAVVSLQGMERKNDEMRGKGTWRRTMRGIEFLKESGCEVGVNFILTNLNLGEIEEVVNFLRERVDHLFFNPVCEAKGFMPTREQVRWLEGKLFELKREHGNFLSNSSEHLRAIVRYLRGERVVECEPFTLHVSLMPNGDLCGCFYPFPVGKVGEGLEEVRLRGKKKREELWRECGGCANSSYFHVTRLFRGSPFYLLERRFSP